MLDVRRGLDGFGWTIDDFSLPVVAPAVVGATDTFLLDSSVLQRRSSMRTVTTQQRRVARDSAKEDELFSECFHGHWNVFYFLGEGDGPPELPKIVTSKSSRPDAYHIVPTELARRDHFLFSSVNY